MSRRVRHEGSYCFFVITSNSSDDRIEYFLVVIRAFSPLLLVAHLPLLMNLHEYRNAPLPTITICYVL